MRYLIDTNIFIFVATDPCRLSRDVKHILSDYETQVCISMESVKELIVAYKNRGFDMRKWHSADEFIRAVRDDHHYSDRNRDYGDIFKTPSERRGGALGPERPCHNIAGPHGEASANIERPQVSLL